MLGLRKLLALRQISQRTISTASRRQIQNKVREHQKLFQDDDGLPVHLKRGLRDDLMYRLTLVLSLGGTCLALYELGVAAMPKKAK